MNWRPLDWLILPIVGMLALVLANNSILHSDLIAVGAALAFWILLITWLVLRRRAQRASA